jgi:hypothetical protein
MHGSKTKKMAMQAATTGSAKSAFNFGSGREHPTTIKATRSIIQRSKMQPALLGRRAESLIKPLSF